jgi:hypothetical protein
MGKPAASQLIQLINRGPGRDAAGGASVEALCASADTALGSKPEGLAPARAVFGPRPAATRRGGSGPRAQALVRGRGVG